MSLAYRKRKKALGREQRHQLAKQTARFSPALLHKKQRRAEARQRAEERKMKTFKRFRRGKLRSA